MDLQTARSLFSYDAETGLLTWLVHRGTRARAGAVAGGVNGDGYRHVCVNRRMFKVHRLAWLLHFGAWPEHEIDHVNGQRDDNRIANLRDVPHALNQLNQRRHRDKSTVTENAKNVTHHRDKRRDSLARARPPKGGMSRCHAVTETGRDVTTDRDSDIPGLLP